MNVACIYLGVFMRFHRKAEIHHIVNVLGATENAKRQEIKINKKHTKVSTFNTCWNRVDETRDGDMIAKGVSRLLSSVIKTELTRNLHSGDFEATYKTLHFF